VESTNETQALSEVRVYPGADGSFDLYSDDGTSYAYERGEMQITHLAWSDTAQRLTGMGTADEAGLVKVVAAR